jgi:DNA-binding PadR family transcriptional regulator
MPRLNLTFTTGLVLQAISSGHQYGFEIMDVSGLPGGTVYPALRRLEAAGHLLSRWEEEDRALGEGRPPRCYYELTPAGQELLAEARARFRGLRWAMGPESGLEPGEA